MKLQEYITLNEIGDPIIAELDRTDLYALLDEAIEHLKNLTECSPDGRQEKI